MKCWSVIFFVCYSSFALTQTAPLRYWVQFTDKTNSEYNVNVPEEFLSSEAVSLRNFFNITITEQDLPVNSSYIEALNMLEGVNVKHVSKWFNAATIALEDSNFIDPVLETLSTLPFVYEVKSALEYTTVLPEEAVYRTQTIVPTYYSSYGASYAQIAINNGHLLHELNYRGAGIKIGVFDSGFNAVQDLEAFQHLRDDGRIHQAKDVVEGDLWVYNGGNHGRSVLSIMAAVIPDSLIGSAPEANYYLFRTENGGSENVIEEDNWVRALEMADSMGIRLINSSLGYRTFDDSLQNHSYADMDGDITRISRAADIAASKGMLIVNSAGNSGTNEDWPQIGAPADADSILAVGALTPLGEYAWFSSIGPSSDGDVKPNVCAVGNQTVFANFSGGISQGNGTSFSSPVITGLTACLWQAFPEKSNMEIIRAIEQSCDLYLNPNDSLGNGTPDYFKAFEILLNKETEEDEMFTAFPNPFYNALNVTINSGQISKAELIDAAGKRIRLDFKAAIGEESSTYRMDIEILGLESGVYTLVLYSENELVSSKRIIKVNSPL